MKIGHPAEKPASQAVTPGAQPATDATKTLAAAAGTAARQTAKVADAGAKVELSSTAATLMSNDVSAEFDAEKVSRISDAIGKGQFKINPEAIADKLISNAQELLTKAKG
jgi:negative regulator of flagellin synthesis FlgM